MTPPVLSTQPNAHTVTFETAGPKPEQVTLMENNSYQRIAFVHQGRTLILLSDGDHWLVTPPPGGGGQP